MSNMSDMSYKDCVLQICSISYTNKDYVLQNNGNIITKFYNVQYK